MDLNEIRNNSVTEWSLDLLVCRQAKIGTGVTAQKNFNPIEIVDE